LWPGKIDKKESSSGAPRKIEGMKSKKVWVIAIEVMKMASVRGVVIDNSVVENDKRIIETRLMWMPGIRPVKVPADTPRRMASISCNNMEFDGFGNF
jgi:hypothetical protein